MVETSPRLCAKVVHLYLVLDVEDIKFVINFDYPNCSEDYIHRIGRTARSSNTGTAYTLFTPGNAKQASDLIAVLREAKQVISPKLLQMAESSRSYHNKGESMVVVVFVVVADTDTYALLCFPPLSPSLPPLPFFLSHTHTYMHMYMEH